MGTDVEGPGHRHGYNLVKKQDSIVNLYINIYIFGRNIEPMSRRSLFSKGKCRVRNVLV
jgi:hypothetical protein